MKNKWENHVAIVTGGAGFVGSALCRHLLDEGCSQVVSIDNYLHGVPEHLEGLGGRLECRQTDLCHQESVNRLLSDVKPTLIFNCAGDTFVPAAYHIPERFVRSNISATLHLMQGARVAAKSARIVHVSSTEVYGSVASRVPIDEAFPLDPENTYAVTKLAGDRLCYTAAVEHGLSTVIARIFNCYGPRETHPYIVPELFRQLRDGSTLTLGNLDSVRDFTWVYDTVRALTALAFADLPPGDVVNVGSGDAVSVEQLAQMAARAAGRRIQDIKQDKQRMRIRDIDWFVCDNSKLRTVTDWTPRVPLQEGLERTWQWYQKHDYTWSWEYKRSDAMTQQ